MSELAYRRFSGFSAAAICVVFNKRGETLVLRSPNPKRGWELPGGAVEEGESVVEAAARETFEETGIQIEVTDLAALYFNAPESRMIFVFRAKRLAGSPTTSIESEEVKWVPEKRLIDTLTRPKNKDRARDALDFDGSIKYVVMRNKPYQVLERLALNECPAK